MLTSRRHSLFFPCKNAAGTGLAAGLPGQPTNVGVQGLPSTSEDTNQYRPRDSADVPNLELVRSGVTVNLGKGVVAISIAPDSHYASCDLWLGGKTEDKSRVNVSVGNPWLGILDDMDSDLRVSLPICAPAIVVDNTGVTTGIIAWDSVQQKVTDTDLNESTIYGFPLRLEVWYSDDHQLVENIPRVSERSELVGHGVIAFLASVTDEGTFYICTHGRRRIDVHVFTTTSVTVEISAVEGMKSPDPDGALDQAATLLLELDPDTGATSAVVAAYDVFSFEGNPITVLKVNLDTTAEPGATFQAQIKVIAQDY